MAFDNTILMHSCEISQLFYILYYQERNI